MMNQSLRIITVLFALVALTTSDVWADYVVTKDETYNSGTMTGTITINPGVTLTSTGYIDNTLLGTGTWYFDKMGDLDLSGKSNLSGFTGTIKLTTGRWRVKPISNLSQTTFDLSDKAQVFISDYGATVGTNLVVHGTSNYGEGNGFLRFATNNVTLTGNISIPTADDSFRVSVRHDSNTSTNTISGVISGLGSLEKIDVGPNASSHGTLILSGANTYSGGTTIAEGVLQLQGSGTLGTGTVTVNKIDSATRDNGVLAFNFSDAYTFGNQLAGDSEIRQIGAGTLTFGATTVNGVNLSGPTSFNGTLTLDTASGNLDFGTLATLDTFNFKQGTITGSTKPSITNLNVLSSMTYSDYTNNLGSKVTTTNPTIANGGVIKVESADDYSAASALFNTSGTGTIQYTGTSFEINDSNSPYEFTKSAAINPVVTINCATETPTVQVTDANNTVTFSQSMSFTGAVKDFVKTGAGTLVTTTMLNTGKTTVEAGTLKVSSSTAADATSSSFEVKSGATLVLHENLYETNKPISGTGVLEIVLNGGGEVLDTTNAGGFQGTLRLAGNTRFRNYSLSKYAGVSFDISNGAQFWIGTGGNYANSFTLSGTNGYTDNRGAFRFDASADGFNNVNENNNLVNISGDIKLAGNTRISTTKGVNNTLQPGLGMFSGKISGEGLLEKNENTEIASNPLNARLILTGDNDYSGGTTIISGTIQLGYKGKVNNNNDSVFDGTTGTLGTGKLTIGSKGVLDYNRVNEYTFTGAVDNSGTINVNSGTFGTSGAFSVPADAASVINVAAGAAYKPTGSVSLVNASTSSHTINLIDATSVLTTSDTLSSSTKVTGEGVWNVQYTAGEKGYGSIASISDFEGDVFLKGVAEGTSGTRLMISGKTGDSAADWTGATVSLDNKMELYMLNSTLTADLAFGASSGYDTGAAVRTDRPSGKDGNCVLNGSISLLDGTIASGAKIYMKNGDYRNDITINSAISGPGALTIQGDNPGKNKATLTSDDIQFNNGFQVNNATVGLASGGRIQLNSDLTLANAGSFTVDAGAALAIGLDSDTTGKTVKLNAPGGTTFDINGTMEISVFSPNDYDAIEIASGSVIDFTDSTILLAMPTDTSAFKEQPVTIDWLKGDGTAMGLNSVLVRLSDPGLLGILNDNQITIGTSASVPEPSTWALLVLGLFGLIWSRRRK